MAPYTYAVGQVLTVESEFEIFLFDTELEEATAEPDIVIRETAETAPATERAAGRLEVAVPSSWAFEWTDAGKPVAFMKVLFTAIQEMLLCREATLCFGSAFSTPAGDSVALFGPSNCGKSTATFHLARQRDYRILGDDLVVCRAGAVYPFPRYVNLPRDVPAVQQWLASGRVPEDRVVEWPGEVGVPRRLVSETVPSRLELDYALVVSPGEPHDGRERRISTEQAMARVARLYDSALSGWTTQPTVRESFDSDETDWQPLVRETLDGATCYRLGATGATLPDSVAGVLER